MFRIVGYRYSFKEPRNNILTITVRDVGNLFSGDGTFVTEEVKLNPQISKFCFFAIC